MVVASDVLRELPLAVASRFGRELAILCGAEYVRTREADVAGGDLLDEHLALFEASRAEWDRWRYLREHVTPDHLRELCNAGAQCASAIDLVAHACPTAKDFAKALRKMFPKGVPDKFEQAVDFAQRRFLDDATIRKRLAKRAKRFASELEGPDAAYVAMFCANVKETGDVIAEMIEQTYQYTNHGPNERLSFAAAKRARFLKHAKPCRAPLHAAATESYVHEELLHSAAVLDPKRTKPILEERWEHYTRNSVHNIPARTTLGAYLRVSPASRALHKAAAAVVKELIAEKTLGWHEVGFLSGIVMGVEQHRIKALFPLLEKIKKAKLEPSPYDNHGERRNAVMIAVLKRRAQNVLGT